MTKPAKKPPTYQGLETPKGATMLKQQGLATLQRAPCQNSHWSKRTTPSNSTFMSSWRIQAPDI